MLAALIPVLVISIVLGAFAVMRIRQGNALAGQEAQYAHARAGAVAQRMGVTLVTGDPDFNFYLNPRLRQGGEALHGNFLSNAGKRLAPECMVRMEGSPGGRRVELLYHDRMKLETGVLEKTLHTWLDARLTVAVHAPFPEFEILTRNPSQYLKLSPQTSLPPQSFGDAALDGVLVLKCIDARVGPVVAPALRLMAQHQYVHIVGRDGVLVFTFTQMATMGMGDADKLLVTLDAMARALEQAAAGHAG
jgi:hypothetical protein